MANGYRGLVRGVGARPVVHKWCVIASGALAHGANIAVPSKAGACLAQKNLDGWITDARITRHGSPSRRSILLCEQNLAKALPAPRFLLLGDF